MRPPDAPKGYIVASAALGAITHARRRGEALLSRTSADAASSLLRGHAAELAISPIGRDQILSVALTAAANDLDGQRPVQLGRADVLPEPSPSPSERIAVRERVFQAGPMPVTASLKALEELERRYRPECSGSEELGRRLAEEASLHEALWDDPRLPGDSRTRFVMLCSVPKLLERAEALAPDLDAGPAPEPAP